MNATALEDTIPNIKTQHCWHLAIPVPYITSDIIKSFILCNNIQMPITQHA